MDDLISNADIRMARATQRVGANAKCSLCTEHDPRCLELHHIAGRKHHDDLVPVCRNCHRKLSDTQRDHSPPVDISNPLEVIGHYLLGLADLFAMLAKRMAEFGHELIELATAPHPMPEECEP